MRFFPLVFSLFMFILVANLIGMLPFVFTITIIVPRIVAGRYALVGGVAVPL